MRLIVVAALSIIAGIAAVKADLSSLQNLATHESESVKIAKLDQTNFVEEVVEQSQAAIVFYYDSKNKTACPDARVDAEADAFIEAAKNLQHFIRAFQIDLASKEVRKFVKIFDFAPTLPDIHAFPVDAEPMGQPDSSGTVRRGKWPDRLKIRFTTENIQRFAVSHVTETTVENITSVSQFEQFLSFVPPGLGVDYPKFVLFSRKERTSPLIFSALSHKFRFRAEFGLVTESVFLELLDAAALNQTAMELRRKQGARVEIEERQRIENRRRILEQVKNADSSSSLVAFSKKELTVERFHSRLGIQQLGVFTFGEHFALDTKYYGAIRQATFEKTDRAARRAREIRAAPYVSRNAVTVRREADEKEDLESIPKNESIFYYCGDHGVSVAPEKDCACLLTFDTTVGVQAPERANVTRIIVDRAMNQLRSNLLLGIQPLHVTEENATNFEKVQQSKRYEFLQLIAGGAPVTPASHDQFIQGTHIVVLRMPHRNAGSCPIMFFPATLDEITDEHVYDVVRCLEQLLDGGLSSYVGEPWV